ncbi:hypothetical protein TRVL_00952 [Trypanosoma vivax]|nr:hypothetical protein TRVL_00952 [Trypanosoma vivax]
MVVAQTPLALNESPHVATGGSSLPSALPPKFSASVNSGDSAKSCASASNTSDCNTVTVTQGSSGATATLQHPFITAADYSDRRQLLSHITVLSGQLQRAELLLSNMPQSAVSQEMVARFDPIIAQAHVERLDGALAQISLLHEVQRNRSMALEAENAVLREERNRLGQRVEMLDERTATLEMENKKLRDALGAAEQEIVVLRDGENRLSHRLHAMEELQQDGGRFSGVNVVVAPPRPACSAALSSLVEEEAIQRLVLLLEMLMEPICIAFDAGVVWIMETQVHREASGGTTAGGQEFRGEGPKMLAGGGSAPDGTFQEAAGKELASLERRNREMHVELDAMKERCRVTEQEKRRLQLLLVEEQRRTESMAKEHYERLQSVHDQVVHERRQLMESLTLEVEEKMRNAFRDGRLYEKKVMQERHERKKTRSVMAPREGVASKQYADSVRECAGVAASTANGGERPGSKDSDTDSSGNLNPSVNGRRARELRGTTVQPLRL